MKTFMTTAATVALVAGMAQAADGTVKVGVLNDQSTSFSALGGSEVVVAVEMAIADFGGEVLGKPIEFVSADHQNKPDVALSIAREWLDTEGVDVIMDVPNSAVALGLNTLIGDSGKMGLFVSPLTDRPTEADCNGHVLAWAYDAYSTVGTAVNAQLDKGLKSFFTLSPDYEAGKVMASWVETAVTEGGGEVVGAVAAPLGTTDFSSYILQAQASGAEVIQINLNGSELINALKQVQEFGLIASGMEVAVTFLHQSDARSIGAEALEGVQFAAPWFWTQDEAARDFGTRMMEATGNAPGWVAAGNYSAAMTYLKAVEAAGTDEPEAVIAQMESMDLDDLFVHNGELYPNGRLIHDMYLLEVRSPAEIGDSQEYFKLEATVLAETAFQPLSATTCPLVNANG
ncbi:ABC transporter substrate-binding protein [Oceanicola sp. S124]|uniref:ABC transporter substrate-binding protein n=1 Tax=Oceanicola sp. S124 TaxID=1042378 RepID=UPI0002557D2B|nr:ABC transporter substrate-binding protein [Oceanicola sp. S124]